MKTKIDKVNKMPSFKVWDQVKYKDWSHIDERFNITELLDVESYDWEVKPWATIRNINDYDEVYDDWLEDLEIDKRWNDFWLFWNKLISKEFLSDNDDCFIEKWINKKWIWYLSLAYKWELVWNFS